MKENLSRCLAYSILGSLCVIGAASIVPNNAVSGQEQVEKEIRSVQEKHGQKKRREHRREACSEESVSVFVEELKNLSAELTHQVGAESAPIVRPIHELILETESYYGNEICLSYQDLSEEKQLFYRELEWLVGDLAQLIDETARLNRRAEPLLL